MPMVSLSTTFSSELRVSIVLVVLVEIKVGNRVDFFCIFEAYATLPAFSSVSNPPSLHPNQASMRVMQANKRVKSGNRLDL